MLFRSISLKAAVSQRKGATTRYIFLLGKSSSAIIHSDCLKIKSKFASKMSNVNKGFFSICEMLFISCTKTTSADWKQPSIFLVFRCCKCSFVQYSTAIVCSFVQWSTFIVWFCTNFRWFSMSFCTIFYFYRSSMYSILLL